MAITKKYFQELSVYRLSSLCNSGVRPSEHKAALSLLLSAVEKFGEDDLPDFITDETAEGIGKEMALGCISAAILFRNQIVSSSLCSILFSKLHILLSQTTNPQKEIEIIMHLTDEVERMMEEI